MSTIRIYNKDDVFVTEYESGAVPNVGDKVCVFLGGIVEKSTSSNYNFKVQVKKDNYLAEVYGGNYYWFLTNDTLLVGDSIRIGKVK